MDLNNDIKIIRRPAVAVNIDRYGAGQHIGDGRLIEAIDYFPKSREISLQTAHNRGL